MAINFFERQDEARRRTVWLLVFFVLGMLTLVVLVYALCSFLFLYLNRQPNEPLRLWDGGLFTAVTMGVSAVVGGGSLMKVAQLSSGGKAVALMLNGQEIQGNTVDLTERRLLNVVEEMAIAAALPMPPVYVLPAETGINAFAAGHGPGDAVVAVSRGCLTYLSRDELQGVIGHEFSHILNGDMRLNLKIIGLVFGIVALSQVGFVIMRTMPSRGSSNSNSKDSGASLFVLGLGLYLLGMGGAFFGWLIQAAVSRQREFLADASSVQFTRNPDGIAGALKKIGGLAAGSRIKNPQAGEVSHMFVSDAFMGQRLTDLLATHPPLDERIRRLDPMFDGTFPEVKPVTVSPVEAQGPRPARVLRILPGLPQVAALGAAAAEVADHVGRVEPPHVAYAQGLHVDIPPRLQDAARSPFSARALIYCLLLDPRSEVRERQLAQLRAGAPPRDVEETMRLAEAVRTLNDAARLPLVDLTLPALRQLSPGQHETFRAQVDGLINADNTVSLFEYALHCVLKRYLDMEYKRVRPAVRYTRMNQVAAPMALVLSHVAWEGHETEADSQAAFAEGMRVYEGSSAPSARFLPRAECTPQAFDQALQTLALAAPGIKRQVVAACAACIKADQQITLREGELFRAICASLGCPMPPLIADEGPGVESKNA
jgi:Zn-dependent protease with chaperone function